MSTRTQILPQDIATEREVVHPALDWRDNTLLMGVMLSSGGVGVLTSRRELLALNRLSWPICERAANFSRSPVNQSVAERFMGNYGAPTNRESAYALVNVPGQLAEYYRRFIVFPETWWPEVIALWTLGTYLYPIFNSYPYLRLTSPEPGCGKSVLGKIISKLSFNGEYMVSPTEANIFRLAESERGTQVWDEVENLTNQDQSRLQAMRAALLNGYSSGASVPRQERSRGGQFKTVRFHLYVPRVLIGLSDLPPVVQQRTLELTLRRCGVGETPELYRTDERREEEEALREKCALYALSYCAHVAHHYRDDKFRRRLESHLGQAGRLPDDLLLPLACVCAGAVDSSARSHHALHPILRRFIHHAAPSLAENWVDTATTTPPWLVAALGYLENSDGMEPAELAAIISSITGTEFSAERIARGLRSYGIRSVRRNGRRVFLVPAEQIAALRVHYRMSGSTEGNTTESTAAVLPTGQ